MRRLLITLDDELDLCLRKYPNQAEIVRDSLRLYHGNITTDAMAGIRSSFKMLAAHIAAMQTKLADIDSKVDYIAGKVQDK